MSLDSICKELRELALGYPGAVQESPWGDWTAKVGGKIFVFVGIHDKRLHVTAKLPRSGLMALGLPFASPTGYGLGKHGWVSARLDDPDEVPVPMFHEWIEESYRAIAGKKLIALLDGAATAAAPAKKKAPPKKTPAPKKPIAAPKKPAARKPAPKRPAARKAG